MGKDTVSTELNGDWTLAGITRHFESLMKLSYESRGSQREIRIDCSKIDNIDAAGYQFLSSWLQCLYFRGNMPKIINFPQKFGMTLPYQSFV